MESSHSGFPFYESTNAGRLVLQIHNDYFTILVDGSPEIVLLTVDSDKDFINVKGVAMATVLSFKPSSISGAELDAEPAP